MAVMNISDNKLNELLNMAGKKLGKDPETLKKQLESGGVEGIMQNLDPKVRERVNSIASNPAQLEALMANNNIKNLIDKFTK